MKKAISTVLIALAASAATPAFADDSAVDMQDMAKEVSSSQHKAIDLPVSGFDLTTLGSNREFMATMASEFEPGYRVVQQSEAFAPTANAGIASLFFPPEYSYRSSAQDSGVDAVTPGRFLSSSVRADYLTDTGPAAADKSSVGLRFGF